MATRYQDQTNPKLRTQLWEYGKRRRTDGPYKDNLEVDALVVGGGFGKSIQDSRYMLIYFC